MIKRIAVAKPNHKAVFGTACRDFALQLRQGTPQSGGEGTGEDKNEHRPVPQELDRINPADLPVLIRRLRRLFRNLRLIPSRRYQSDAGARAVDLGKSVFRSLRFGGEWVPISFRRKKMRQPHLVLLCDVSASMIQNVAFTVPLLFALSHSTQKVHSFVCAGDLEPVTSYFNRSRDFFSAIDKMLTETLQVGQGTKLGKSLQQLSRQPELSLNSSTCLVILSDAETVEPNECAQMLKSISSHVRKIVWLNTQRKESWNQPIVKEFRRYCRMEECFSVRSAVRILKKL